MSISIFFSFLLLFHWGKFAVFTSLHVFENFSYYLFCRFRLTIQNRNGNLTKNIFEITLFYQTINATQTTLIPIIGKMLKIRPVYWPG